MGRLGRQFLTAPTTVAVESGVRHTVFRTKPGTVGYDRKRLRCGLPSRHAPLHGGEEGQHAHARHSRAHHHAVGRRHRRGGRNRPRVPRAHHHGPGGIPRPQPPCSGSHTLGEELAPLSQPRTHTKKVPAPRRKLPEPGASPRSEAPPGTTPSPPGRRPAAVRGPGRIRVSAAVETWADSYNRTHSTCVSQIGRFSNAPSTPPRGPGGPAAADVQPGPTPVAVLAQRGADLQPPSARPTTGCKPSQARAGWTILRRDKPLPEFFDKTWRPSEIEPTTPTHPCP